MRTLLVIAELFLIIYFYIIFYLLVLLALPNTDILIRVLVLVLILFLLNLDSKMGKVIDFISSTSQIMLVAFVAVIGGLLLTNIIARIFDYIISRSKYDPTIEAELNGSVIILMVVVLWFLASYFLFYFITKFISKLKIKGERIMTLNRLHYKMLEAGTVLSGFISLLVSVAVKPEINGTINQMIVGIYLLCLIPFLYFHFNENLIED